MNRGTRIFIYRKLTTTFVTTAFLSTFFALFTFNIGFEAEYNQGNQFLGWLYVYMLYIGLIILLYGNMVSMAIEYLQGKWFQQHDWLYVTLHGLFGLANGILFQSLLAAVYGMAAAFSYGIIDKWLHARSKEAKKMKVVFFIPVAAIVLCWGYLQIISPPMPPFTAEDAILEATSGEDSITEGFPRYVGQREEKIEDYRVIKETNVEKVGKETYLVTFTEAWKKGDEKDVGEFAYKVDRNSITAHSLQGAYK
ncbi:hypothetical protein [Oceanobacillus alkalisoli]|uniref:hypothetical protein n=1 Tax=Oceanobacillus alkalisoli TaxID=2925113 RepID=UPI001F11F465|nr:hypothetical protein [Oceanobacillus alkalisoli]MCF3944804.1 hypothetical protein [Oceanobacillus alkalisoli]